MRITDRFRSEHQDFLRELAEVRRLNDDGPHVAQIVEDVRALSLPLFDHAGREEVALFPALADAFGTGGGPLGVLTEEHHRIHGLVAQILAVPRPLELAQLVRSFVAVLEGHIDKEDDALFPAAESILGEERLRDLDTVSLSASVS